MLKVTLIKLILIPFLSAAFLSLCFGENSIDSIVGLNLTYSKTVISLVSVPEEELLSGMNKNMDTVLKIQVLNALCWQNFRNHPEKAMNYATSELELVRLSGNREGLSTALDNMAYLHLDQSEFQLALDYSLQSLKVKESDLDSAGISVSLAGIGNIHYRLLNYMECLKYWKASMEIDSIMKNQQQISSTLSNIGLVYEKMNMHDDALRVYKRSLALQDEIDANTGATLNNIGEIFMIKGEFDLALKYFQEALDIVKDYKDKDPLCIIHINLAELYFQHARISEALKHGLIAANLAEGLSSKNNMIRSYTVLSDGYEGSGNLNMGYKYLKMAFELKDEVFSSEMSTQFAEMETKYKTEKKENENKMLKQENELRIYKEKQELELMKRQVEKNNRRDIIQYSIILIAILILFSSVLFMGFVSVSEKMAEGLIFFSFLIFFEFLLVIADPFVESVTGGAPGWKLLINAGIAALIFPAHAFFENTIKKRILNK